MINDYKMQEALLDKLRAFCTVNSYELDVDGVETSREPDETYLSEMFLHNKAFSVGLESTSSDITRPIYQIDIHTPKKQGKWVVSNIGNQLREEFPKASFVINNPDQKIQVQSVDVVRLKETDTHYVYAVSVNLTVIATNT